MSNPVCNCNSKSYELIFMKNLPELHFSLTLIPLNVGGYPDREPDPGFFEWLHQLPLSPCLPRRRCLRTSPVRLREVVLMSFFKWEYSYSFSNPIALTDVSALWVLPVFIFIIISDIIIVSLSTILLLLSLLSLSLLISLYAMLLLPLSLSSRKVMFLVTLVILLVSRLAM